jgi:diadenylate cyclase
MKGAPVGEMTWIKDFFQQLGGFEFRDVLDILVVTILFYKLLPMFRSSGSMRILKVIGLLVVLTWVTDFFRLNTLNFLLDRLVEVGLIAIVVLFQPELRRMLDRLMSTDLKTFVGIKKPKQELDPVISQTVMACEVMSREKVGALIVFARETPLEEFVKTGTLIDAQVSEQLIRNIFFPKAALHDGAMVVQNGRVTAAGCVLPLSSTNRLSADLGTRHRAGVGMSEATDAVVVIVSEETGTISVAVSGMLKRHLAPQTLERLLRTELCHPEAEKNDNMVLRLTQKLSMKKKEDGGDEK